MQNNYFDKDHPLRPYMHSLSFRPGSVRPSNALRVDLPFAFIDPETGEELGDGIIPKKENVPAEYEGFWPCEKDGGWVLIEDHRGKEGYLDGKPHTITEQGPLPDTWSDAPPEPTQEEIDAAARAYVYGQLAALDAEYLTPRTLAGLPFGDEYALESRRLHEEKAKPWRDRLAAIPEAETV